MINISYTQKMLNFTRISMVRSFFTKNPLQSKKSTFFCKTPTSYFWCTLLILLVHTPYYFGALSSYLWCTHLKLLVPPPYIFGAPYSYSWCPLLIFLVPLPFIFGAHQIAQATYNEDIFLTKTVPKGVHKNF